MTIEEARTFLDNLKVCIKEHPIVADWLVEIADRKTEPQTENLFTDKYGDVWEWRGDAWYCISGQDEPQTCEECEHWSDTEDGCADRHGCKTEPYIDIETGILHWCGWKYKRIYEDEPQTEPLPKTINGVRIADAVAWADKWLEDNSVSEMWDMIRTLRDATEWQDEPQTEREGE